jgi:carboxypeptidase T
MRRFRPRTAALAVAVIATLAITTPAAAGPTRPSPAEEAGHYQVPGVRTPARRNAIAATGASIDGIEHGVADISAVPSEVDRLRRLGFTVTAVPAPAPDGVGIFDFPPADSAYHNYAEMTSEIDGLVAAHPSILSRFSVGQSFQSRDLIGLKVSDNVGTDEDEPEVLFTAHQHAREHLTVEMALYLLRQLVDGYGTDARVTSLVDTREIWILPDLNPDGGEFDIATG